uniref:Uncharacterized protein n=1 Tax=Heterosigma akashiwo TaxID=2829 RepID=A0A7S3URB7_HETAK
MDLGRRIVNTLFFAVVILLCFSATRLLAERGILDSECNPIDCPNTDCGSCGGSACCKLQIWYEWGDTEDIANALSKAFQSKIDGTFELEVTRQGDLGISDIRERMSRDETADYVGEMTRYPNPDSADEFYRISFGIQPRLQGAMLNVFSMSSSAGAYCDRGQNWANIKEVAEAVGLGYTLTHQDESCFKFTPDGEVLSRLAHTGEDGRRR